MLGIYDYLCTFLDVHQGRTPLTDHLVYIVMVITTHYSLHTTHYPTLHTTHYTLHQKKNGCQLILGNYAYKINTSNIG